MKFSKYEVTLLNGDKHTVNTGESVDIFANENGFTIFSDAKSGSFIALFPQSQVASIIGIEDKKDEQETGTPNKSVLRPFLGDALEKLKKDIESGKVAWGHEGVRDIPIRRYGCPCDAPLPYSLMRVMS